MLAMCCRLLMARKWWPSLAIRWSFAAKYLLCPDSARSSCPTTNGQKATRTAVVTSSFWMVCALGRYSVKLWRQHQKTCPLSTRGKVLPLSLNGRTGSRKRAILAMRRITLSTKNAKKSRIRAKRDALTAKQPFVLSYPLIVRKRNTGRFWPLFGRVGRWRPPRPVVRVQRYCAVVLPHSWLAGLGHHHITRITRGG